MENNDTHEIVKAIKQEFFAYRNGALVDALRRRNDVHKTILGLNIPQVQEIAARFSPDKAVAEELWANTSHRECRLAAPLLYPLPLFSLDDATRWALSVENEEIADFLCLRLLRYTTFAPLVINSYIDSSKPLVRYIAFRLLLNLIVIGKYPDSLRALQLAQSALLSSAHSATIDVANRIIDSINGV